MDKNKYDSDDKKHGYWEYLINFNTVLYSKGYYEHGVKVGEWVFYRPTGGIAMIGNMMDGEMSGEWKDGDGFISFFVTCPTWPITVFSINNKIRIGCKVKTIEEWDSWFNGREVYQTPRGTKEFEGIHEGYLKARGWLLTHIESKDKTI